MKELTEYFNLQQKIYEYFGYSEDWKVIPLDDSREYYWYVDGEDRGTVCFAETEKDLEDQEGQYYEDEIYTQRFLKKYVYRGAEFTMIACDPHTDGNKFLRISDNAKERKPA